MNIAKKVRAVALVGLFVTVPALADAPADQYESFVDTDTLIVDRFTHLAWERPRSTTPYPSALTYDLAVVHCQNRSQRMPSLKELLTLVDETPHQEYDRVTGLAVTKMIDPSAFKGTPVNATFWTSSKLPEPKSGYVTVDFATGLTSEASSSDSRYVRCVTAQ